MTKNVIKNLEQVVELLRRADNTLMDAMDEAEKEDSTYDIYDNLVEPSNTLGDIRSEITNILGRCRKIKDSKFRDSKPASTTDIKKHIVDFVDQWLNNDYDEESEKYDDAFINIRDDDRLLTTVALKLKKLLIEEDLDLRNLEDAPDINYWTYDLMKKFARRSKLTTKVTDSREYIYKGYHIWKDEDGYRKGWVITDAYGSDVTPGYIFRSVKEAKEEIDAGVAFPIDEDDTDISKTV